MTCKNCGADLKPGIKYCLECGNYIDEEDNKNYDMDIMDMVDNNKPIEFGEEIDVPKKKKNKLKTSDLIIYLALIGVIVVSLIVIVVTVINDNKKNEVKPEPTPVYTDKEVSVDDYQITIPGKLAYDVQGSIVSISDNQNYTFNYRNKLDDYNKYASDLTILSKDLEKSNYQILSTEKKEVNSHEFLIYKIIANSKTKYLYVTQVNVKYVSMGIIEALGNGNWELALKTICDINDKIEFNTIYDESDNIVSGEKKN